MYRHTRFRKLFHQSIRIGNIGCRNDKYLVDPLPADISSCIFFVGYYRNACDFRTAEIIIDNYQTG